MHIVANKRFENEEKIEVVKRILAGEDLAKLSTEKKVTINVLHGWRKQFAAEAMKKPRIIDHSVTVEAKEPELVLEAPKEKPEITPDLKKLVVEEFRSGTKAKEISEVFGIPITTVYGWVKAAKDRELKAKSKAKEPVIEDEHEEDEPIIKKAVPLAPEFKPNVETQSIERVVINKPEPVFQVPTKKEPETFHGYTLEEIENALDENEELKILCAEQMLEIMKLKLREKMKRYKLIHEEDAVIYWDEIQNKEVEKFDYPLNFDPNVFLDEMNKLDERIRGELPVSYYALIAEDDLRKQAREE